MGKCRDAWFCEKAKDVPTGFDTSQETREEAGMFVWTNISPMSYNTILPKNAHLCAVFQAVLFFQMAFFCCPGSSPSETIVGRTVQQDSIS